MPRRKHLATLDRRASLRLIAASLARRVTAGAVSPAIVHGACYKCGNEWAAARVTLNFTSVVRFTRYATAECARCGHTWARIAADPARLPVQTGGCQRVRLTLILPADTLRTWHAHGTWHRSGDEETALRDASLADLETALRDWRKRQLAYAQRKEKAAVKAATQKHLDLAVMQSLYAKWRERDAEEAAARAREAENA